MNGINKVILLGTLGRDPESKSTAGGKTMTKISVATSEKWKDKHTDEMKEQTEWHQVVFFGRLAEIAAQYLKKGSQVFIEGKNQTRKWQGQDGQDRYTTEVIALEMQMVGNRNAGASSDSPAKPSTQQRQQPMPDDGFDDIPF